MYSKSFILLRLSISITLQWFDIYQSTVVLFSKVFTCKHKKLFHWYFMHYNLAVQDMFPPSALLCLYLNSRQNYFQTLRLEYDHFFFQIFHTMPWNCHFINLWLLNISTSQPSQHAQAPVVNLNYIWNSERVLVDMLKTCSNS